MWETLKIVILSAVSGFTALLPVPSLGHFSLLKEVFGFADNKFNSGFYYALFMLAASLAMYIVYAKTHRRIIKSFFLSKKKLENAPKFYAYRKAGRNIFLSLIPLLALAVPTGKMKFVGSLTNNFISGGSLVFTGISALFCSVLMYVSYWYTKHAEAEKVSILAKKNAFLFGLYQLPAYIFPGISHISMGVSRTAVCDIDIRNIFKEAYLYIAPALLIVNSVKAVYCYLTVGGVNITAAVIGFVVSFIFSLITLKAVNKAFTKKTYKIFTVYTFVFGLAVTATALIEMFV